VELLRGESSTPRFVTVAELARLLAPGRSRRRETVRSIRGSHWRDRIAGADEATVSLD
jgi:hypothetical protein